MYSGLEIKNLQKHKMKRLEKKCFRKEGYVKNM